MISNLGRIIPINRGEWSGTTHYQKFDVVIYNNISYICNVPGVSTKLPVRTPVSWTPFPVDALISIPDGPTANLKGDTGPQGIQGIPGVSNIPGPQGPIGLTGPQGIKGDQGIQGDMGLTGPQGPKGDVGTQGIQGIKGDTGLQGDAGPQGIQGIKGDTGLQGIQGDPGLQGLKGNDGLGSIVGATANQIIGVNALNDAVEFKSIVSGSNVTITHDVGTITIAAAGGGGDTGGASSTEISYLMGVTSPIQLQIDAKAPLNNPVFTGKVKDAKGDVRTLWPLTPSLDITASNAGGMLILTSQINLSSNTAFTQGETVVLYNDTDTSITVSIGDITAYLAGQHTPISGFLSLAAGGLATIICISSHKYVIASNSLS